MYAINVRNNNGRCLLRFTHLGNVYSLTLGDYKNPSDRRKAGKIALEIVEEIENGTFNGVDKWKIKKEGINKAFIIDKIAIRHLFNQSPQLKGIYSHLTRYKGEIRNSSEAKRFFDSLDVTTATKRRYYTAIRTILELKDTFTFEIKAPKDEEKKEIDPFTSSEIEKIKEMIKGNHYETFILFLLYTGCRPSEAIGIRWSDIEWENNRIRFASSLSRGKNRGERVRKTTKTGKVRFCPMGDELSGILERKLENTEDDDATSGSLVFLNPDNLPICDDSFRKEWIKLLRSAGVRYRPPYNLRHTFISHCLVKGIDAVTVASWVGNSPEMIYKHYAGLVGDTPIPSLYTNS